MMCKFYILLFLLTSYICNTELKILHNKLSRQKRCIVIQKQSGTHGDSNEADEDYPSQPERRPAPAHPKDLRRPSANPHRYDSKHEDNMNESFAPDFLKYVELLPRIRRGYRRHLAKKPANQNGG